MRSTLMPNRGSLVVLLLLLAGLIVSAVAVLHHWRQTRRPLELWGADGALLIERAPQVTLFRLEVNETAAVAEHVPTIHIAGRQYVLADEFDMQGAPGFSHVRWGFCQDSSYAWDKDCAACGEPQWQYALRFADGENQIMLALDTNCALVAQIGVDRCVSFAPIGEEVASVLRRQLPDRSQ
jgi:hypothetical protein